MTDQITLFSPAKINLYLRILNKREDGFHNLETIYQEIKLADVLTFQKQKKTGVRLEISAFAGQIPEDERNLICQAAAEIFSQAQIKEGILVKVTKRVPVGAGLGGGSSNAATTLKAINWLWQLDWSMERLTEIAATLGADVPFFIRGKTALGKGKGELLTPLPSWEDFHLLLIYPHFSISTAEMYTAWDRLKSKKLAPPLNPLLTALSQKNLPQIGQHLYNDFEQILFPQYPLLKKLKVKLKELGCLGCLVSGSGASVFGIFEGKKEKERAIKSLRSEFADFFVF